MKRYIKSSFDPSIPSWLKTSIDHQKYNKLSDKIVSKYNIALSDAKFFDHEVPNSIPIYLVQGDWTTEIYVPGINDDTSIDINHRSRKLGSIAKSKLPSLSNDIVWLDLSNKLDKSKQIDRYRDPRRIYENGSKDGYYAGQYHTNGYTKYDGTEVPDHWSETGRRPRYGSYRDKSGYEVPSPEERLQRYYETFPDNVTKKVDALYERILEVKDKVLSPELINTPYDRDEEMSLGNATYRIHDAIGEYRELLAMLDKDTGKLSDDKDNTSWRYEYAYKEFSKKVRTISKELDEAEHYLTSRW